MDSSDYISLGQTLLLVTILYLLITKNTLTSIKRENKIILDTCALIDGRILEVSNAGFIASQIIVPDFILNELQLLADGSDSHKRERARHGLDIVKTLQDDHVNTKIVKYKTNEKLPADDKLVLLAKKLKADLCTTDYNLNKVASIHGVKVLNVNELSNALRPVLLPGEKKNIKIVQKGSGKGQGVGYLDDGSMVVVGNAVGLVGKNVDVEVSRYIQTDAGKMLFANVIKQKSNRAKRS